MSEIPADHYDHPGRYEIRLQGHLDSSWAAWFDGLALAHDSDGTTIIHGPVADQAALYGLLQKTRDLGLPLISVNHVERSRPAVRIPLRVSGLEPTPGIDARDLHEPLTTGTLELLHDHGHGRDDGAYGQSEAPRSLLTLGVADVVHPRLLDRVAFARIAELSAVDDLHGCVFVDEKTHPAARGAGS